MNQGLVPRLLASTAVLAISVYAPPLSAQSPQTPTVAAGSIAVTRQGATTVITQGTEKGIIDWRSFSVGPQETVRFDQPGRSSVTLNRVTGTELSRIDGRLTATGQVWLANPNGVMIGPGGQVNVGGLLATTGRIDAGEFLRSGRAAIDQIGKDAAIVNSGAITVGEGGYAALAAAAIRNEGVIAARSGSIALGSGKAVTVDFAGDRLITYQVTQPLDSAPAGADAALSSTGTLAAEGGTVLLSARAAKGVMDNVINLKGLVVSNSVKVDGGTVVFGDGGSVQVSAKIDATSATGQGGAVAVLGEKVGLMDGAAIDASGATGGGTVLVGGDWQGLGEPGARGQNAQVAYVAPTASIKAEATQSGTGGKVVVWADDTTRFNGAINALGGSVETSGKKTLLIGPNAAVKAGAWLLDPTDITITTSGTGSLTGGIFSPGTSSTIDPATISAGLSTGDVTIQTAAGAGNGDIIFTSGTISTTSGTARTLKLLADRNVDIQAGAAILLSGAAHNVTLNSGANYTTQNTVVGGVQVIGATITTTGGSISMVGGLNGAFRARGYDASGAPFTAGVAVWGSVLDAGAGAITIRGEGSPNYIASGGPGVQVVNNGAVGATVTAGGGITFEGYGSPNALDNSVGLTVGNFVAGTATLVQATGTGAISLIGRRGSGNTARNIAVLGVGVTPTLSSVGGNIIVDASFSGGTGSNSQGITLQNGLITTSVGTISITGTGAGTGAGNTGVSIGVGANPGTISVTGNGGAINLKTQGGVLSAGDILINNNSRITYAGNIARQLKIEAEQDITFNTGSTVSLLGAAHDILLNSGVTGASQATVAGGIAMTGATLQTAGGSISLVGGVGGAFAAMGSATLHDFGLNLRSGVGLSTATIDAGSGSITIKGNARTGLSGAYELGVYIGGTTSTLAATGAISITGVGGNSASTESVGVAINSGSVGTINAGAGGLTITGTGGTSGSSTSYAGTGVLFRNMALTMGSGNLAMTGTGGANVTGGSANHGIVFGTGTNINGSGTISITGTGGSGAAGHGVDVSGSAVITSTGAGPISITGTGSTLATVSASGIFLGSSTLSATGAGSISIVGTSAGNATTTDGVNISNSQISVGAGGLSVVGAGSSAGGVNARGVAIFTGTITSAGAVSISGTGGGGTSPAHGVFVASNSVINASGTAPIEIQGVRGNAAESSNIYLSGAGTISTVGGSLTLLGTTSAGGVSLRNFGVALNNGMLVSTVSGTISISGTGGLLGGVNFGIALGAGSSSSTVRATGSGVILLNGAAPGSGVGVSAYGTTLSTANGNITFTTDTLDTTTSNYSATGGTLTFQPTAGTVSIGVNGGAGTLQISAATLAAHAGGAILIGRADLTANMSVAGAMILSQATFLRTGGGNIISTGTIDGAVAGGQALTINAPGGTLTIGGNIGSTASLASINVTAGMVTTPASSSFTVTTVGTQSWNAPLVLRGDGSGSFANFNTTNADIHFANTINSAGGGQEQSVNIGAGTGTVSLGGSVGATITPINFFTYSGSGAGKLITKGDISSIRSQTYTGSVEAQSATNFNANGFSIAFNGSLDGPGAVTVDTVQINAQATFNGSIGAITPLASFTRTGGPTVFGLGATLVRSVGPQTYALGGSSSAAITLAAPNTTFSTTNAAISFAGPIDSASTLSYAGMTVAAGTGAVSFANNFGQGTNLASFTSTGTGTITLGGFHRTQGTQSYNGAILLQGSPTFGTNNADLIFNGQLNAATAGFQSLVAAITGTGKVSLVGGVGGTSALGSISISNAILGGTIVTTGAQSYSGATRLIANTKLSTTNTPIYFVSTLDGPGGLDLVSGGGSVTLAGAVGATTALAYFNQGGSGSLSVSNNVITSGAQSFASPVVLAGSATFSTSNAAVTFAGPVNGLSAGSASLTVSTGTGAISFGSNVGAVTSLNSITQVGTGTTSMGGPTLVTTGLQHYAGPVVLTTANVSFTSGFDLRFDAPINGSFAGLNQAVFNATGTVTLAGGAGGSVALSSITLPGVSAIGGTIATSGAQSYAGTVNLIGATTLSTPGGQVTISNTVIGPHNLAVNANLTRLGGVSIITTGATQSYGGAMILDGDVILSGGVAILNGTVNSSTGGQFLQANTNSVTFNAAVGGGTPLASLSTGVSVDALVVGPVITSGSQSYGGAVRLGGATSLTTLTTTAGDIRFNGVVNSGGGSQSLVVSAGGGGVVSFAGSLGATTAINSLSITTNGSSVNLPTTTAATLTVATGGGSLTQTGALTVTGAASFMTGGGAIALNSFANNFNTVSLSTTNSASIRDAAGGVVIVGAQALSLSLDSNSAVTQTGGIDATSLSVSGSGNFMLTGTNTIGTLSGSGSGTVTVANAAAPGLTVGNLTGSAITLNQSGAGNYINLVGLLSTAGLATLAAPGDVDVNGALSAGSANLSAGGTISGLGTITVTSAPMTISANGGAINPIVNGVSGPAVATSAFVNVTSGSITVNGSTLSATSATVAPTTPSVASVPTVATVATIATVASVATVATVASVATVATVATIAVPATVPTLATIAFVPTLPTLPFLADPGVNPIIRNPSLLAGLIPAPLAPALNFDLAPNAPGSSATVAGRGGASASGATGFGSGQQRGPQSASAQSVRDTVTNTPSGMLIPVSSPIVAGTGAPLIATPTVKVDAADTGGANGQVVASSVVAEGRGGRVIVSGLVSEGGSAARTAPAEPPPLAQQPSTMNEEPLLD